jgi:hypothetical protein
MLKFFISFVWTIAVLLCLDLSFSLLNEPSTIAVILGLIILFALVVSTYYLIKNVFKQ